MTNEVTAHLEYRGEVGSKSTDISKLGVNNFRDAIESFLREISRGLYLHTKISIV